MFLPMPKLPAPGRVYIPFPHAPRIKATFRVRITFKGHKIRSYIQRWENMFLRRAGASLRAYVIKRFKRKRDVNVHSTPPASPYLHKPKSQFVRIAIRYFVDYRRRETIVGPIYSVAKLWGWKHEHGKRMRREKYPKRPFMGPEFKRWVKIGAPTIMKDIKSKMAGGN